MLYKIHSVAKNDAYHTADYIKDIRKHGVGVFEEDINHKGWKSGKFTMTEESYKLISTTVGCPKSLYFFAVKLSQVKEVKSK